MVWSEYRDEAHAADHEYSGFSDDDNLEDGDRYMTCDEWTVWHSQDLMNMWMSLRAYREDSGTTNSILKIATYTDFCEFCYRFSNR